MLDSVVLKGGPHVYGLVTAGSLAEALIYYDKIRLVLKAGTIQRLAQQLGQVEFEALINSSHVDIIIMQGSAVTFNMQTPTGTAFNYETMRQSKRNNSAFSDSEFLEQHLRRATSARGWSRKLSKRIAESADTIATDGKLPNGLSIIESARLDIENEKLFQRLLAAGLPWIAPGYAPPPHWYAKAVKRLDGGYSLDTNLDLSALARFHLASRPEGEVFNVGNLVGCVVEAYEDLLVQAKYEGDLQCGELSGRLIRARVDAAFERASGHREQIDRFQDALMPNGRKLAEAVDAGEIPFREILNLREKRQKFGEWLRGQSPDANLLLAYLDEIHATSFLGKLPSKHVRFLIFAALGLGVGTLDPVTGGALGIGLSAVDEYLLDRLMHGWKPNQFVSKLVDIYPKQ